MTAIEDVKTRLDIVETISSYVPELRQLGRSWKARCPFHQERTPSFVVDPARGSWHCFGACATGGDVIEFVRRVEGLDFREALRLCAQRAGVELRAPSARERVEREEHERLLSANEAAAVFFRAQLDGTAGNDARRYVAGRGLDDATIERWQIGYAPDGWSVLVDHLTARGFTAADLLAAGLTVEGDRGPYDRFRHRLIFPTRDQRRRLVGFGARALRPGDEPKYLNTPRTALFDKSGALYGIDLAWEAVRREDQAVVVEGYMDVIAAHQFGFTNTVASMGTALTEKQMQLLKRFTVNFVLALDADEAGSEATLRGVQIAASAADHERVPVVDWRGLVSYQDALKADIRVSSLDAGDDPDSLIRRDADGFRALLAGARSVTDHLFASIGDQIDPGNPRARSEAVRSLAPTVAAIIDPVVQSHYVQRLARLGGIDERMALQLVTRGGAGRPRPVATRTEVSQARRTRPVVADGESQILQLLFQRPECRDAGEALDGSLFEDPLNRALWEHWREQQPLDDESQPDEIDDALRERRHELEAAALPDYPPAQLTEMVAAMAAALRMRRRQERVQAAALDQAEALRAARMGRAGPDTDDQNPEGESSGDPGPDELGGLGDQLAETVERQRALNRELQVARGRRKDDPGP